MCLFRLHGVNSFVQLIRSRYQPIPQGPPMVAHSSSSVQPEQQVSPFQLEELNEDLVLNFIRGKPLIETPVESQAFKFKKMDQKQEPGISQE